MTWFSVTRLHSLALLLCVAGAAACGGGDSGGDTPAPKVMLKSQSGVDVDWNGTWSSTCSTPSNDVRIVMVTDGLDYTVSVLDYASSDGTCSGASTVQSAKSGHVTAQGTRVMANGWSDRVSLVTAPVPRSGSGTLNDPATATMLSVTEVATAGSPTLVFYYLIFVDDSAGPPLDMYFGTGSPGLTAPDGCWIDNTGAEGCMDITVRLNR